MTIEEFANYEKLVDLAAKAASKYENDKYVREAEKIILGLKNPKLCYLFAKSVKGADVKAHGRVVIESKNLMWNYAFAFIKGADVKAHGKVIIDSKDPEMNYYFAYIKGADVKAHGRVVIGSKDPKWNFKFARFVQGADVKAHQKVIIENGDTDYIVKFAMHVKDADVKALQSAAMNSTQKKNDKELKSFIKEIKRTSK